MLAAHGFTGMDKMQPKLAMSGASKMKISYLIECCTVSIWDIRLSSPNSIKDCRGHFFERE